MGVAPSCGMGAAATCNLGTDRGCTSCAACSGDSHWWPVPEGRDCSSALPEPLAGWTDRSFCQGSGPATARGEVSREAGGAGAAPAATPRPSAAGPEPLPFHCPDPGAEGAASEVLLSRPLVETFVRGLVKGIKVSVVSTSGEHVECILAVDREITTLSLQRSNRKDSKKRQIPLWQIHKICTGSCVDDDVELFMDETCVTLLLKDGQMVSFSFDDRQDRNVFARCLSAFVDGHHGRGGRQRLAGSGGSSTPRAKGRLLGGSRDDGLEDPDTLSLPACQSSPPLQLPELPPRRPPELGA